MAVKFPPTSHIKVALGIQPDGPVIKKICTRRRRKSFK